MKPVLNISINVNNTYDKDDILTKVIDRLKIKVNEQYFISDLNLNIFNIKLPSNINKKAYFNNIRLSKKIIRNSSMMLSPKAVRIYDYHILNSFQRRLLANGIVKSIQLVFRKTNKSIRDSIILVEDASEDIAYEIIKELSKYTRHIILLSNNLKRCSVIREYIIANYGVSPVITLDHMYAIKISDFIISTKEYDYINKNVWYLNNLYAPLKTAAFTVNDIDFKVPWESNIDYMPPELLGAILNQMEELDIDKALEYNGIILDRIKFNDETIEF